MHERLSLELAGDDLGGALELPQVDLAAGGLAQRLPRVAVLKLVAEQRVLEGREQEAELGAACVQGCVQARGAQAWSARGTGS